MEAITLETEKYTELFRKSIEAGKKLRILARSNLEKIGYAWDEYDILRRISNSERKNISDIAAGSCRQKSNIIPIINAFEEKGYLNRERDSNDRRNVWITLTEKGEREKKRVQDYQKEFIIDLLNGIDTDVLFDMLGGFDKMISILNGKLADRSNSQE